MGLPAELWSMILTELLNDKGGLVSLWFSIRRASQSLRSIADRIVLSELLPQTKLILDPQLMQDSSERSGHIFPCCLGDEFANPNAVEIVFDSLTGKDMQAFFKPQSGMASVKFGLYIKKLKALQNYTWHHHPSARQFPFRVQLGAYTNDVKLAGLHDFSPQKQTPGILVDWKRLIPEVLSQENEIDWDKRWVMNGTRLTDCGTIK